jgi:hypothetical protein
MKNILTTIRTLGASVALLLAACVTAKAAGVTFYADRNFGGSRSREFDVGTYTMAQMIANRCPNDWLDSFTWTYPGWGSHTVTLFSDDNFSGYKRVYTVRSKCPPSNSTSSIKIQAGVPAGYTYAAAGGGLEEFQAGYIFGDWIQMHHGDWVELASSGTSEYIVRYETEYWVKSGALAQPIVQVTSGTNVLLSTSGRSELGTCTGTAFPWEARYRLNGRVKWTNNEGSGSCAYNLTFRDGTP